MNCCVVFWGPWLRLRAHPQGHSHRDAHSLGGALFLILVLLFTRRPCGLTDPRQCPHPPPLHTMVPLTTTSHPIYTTNFPAYFFFTFFVAPSSSLFAVPRSALHAPFSVRISPRSRSKIATLIDLKSSGFGARGKNELSWCYVHTINMMSRGLRLSQGKIIIITNQHFCLINNSSWSIRWRIGGNMSPKNFIPKFDYRQGDCLQF